MSFLDTVAGTHGDAHSDDLVLRDILGVEFLPLCKEDAVEFLDRSVQKGRSFKIAFGNANLLNCSSRDLSLRERLRRFVVFNDGIGVDIAMKILFGEKFPGNLNGTDFIPLYLERTSLKHRIFLLGAERSVVEKTARVFAEIFPRHEIAGFCDGFQVKESYGSLARRIRESGATLVLVAMGNPLQEVWLDQYFEVTGARLGFGVGALFDFMSGTSKRAPMWLREMRCEWIWRLVSEPRRLARRYLLGNSVFLMRVLGAKIFSRRQDRAD